MFQSILLYWSNVRKKKAEKPHLLSNKNDRLPYESDLWEVTKYGNLEKRVKKQIEIPDNLNSKDF